MRGTMGLMATNPHQEVLSLIEKMKHAARQPVRFERLCDELSVLTRAYMLPSIGENWLQYGIKGRQAQLADFLHSRLNKPVPLEAIMDALYFHHGGSEPGIRILHVFLCHLRKKLKNSPYRIETIHGFGFSMVCDKR